MLENLAKARLFEGCVGMVNRHPTWKLDTKALAVMLNVRVYDDEVMTTNGRDKENATAMSGAGAIEGMEFGVRSDGTEDLIVATDGGYWKVSGDTKTLISKAPQIGEASVEVTGTGLLAITGTSTQWTEDISSGDMFYFTADGITAATQITSVDSDTKFTLSEAYQGSETAGAYTIWDKQTDARTCILKYMDKWFFCNGTDRPMQWTPETDEFREVGFGTASVPSAVSATGSGNLEVNKWYGYKVCRESLVGSYRRYGNASTYNDEYSGADGTIQINAFDSFPAWQTHWRIYRTVAQDAQADVSTAPFYHLTSVPVSSVSAAAWLSTGAWLDTLADSVINNSLANVSDRAPTRNSQPPLGADYVLLHKDRLLWTSGSDLYIGGLPPYDYHSDAKGRYEPEYAPDSQIRYIGRDTRDKVGCKGAFEQNGIAHFLRSRTLYALRSESDDPTVWQTVVARYDVGGESPWSVAQDGRYTYWIGRLAGRLGIMRFNGAIVDNIGALIQGSVDNFTITALSAAAAGCSEGYYYLSLDVTGAGKTYEWNTDRGNGQGAWSEKDWKAECFCQGTDRGYCGDSSGFVYQLEQGLDEAGAAITRRIETGTVRFRDQDPHSDRYWKIAGRLYAEIYSENGFAALSAWYKKNEGDWIAISGYPISASAGATVYRTMFLPDTPNGRGFSFKFESSGTAEDWTFRDLWFDGEVKPAYHEDETQE